MTVSKNQNEKDFKIKSQSVNNKNKFENIAKINKPMETSIYYGFSPIKEPAVEEIDWDNVKILTEKESSFEDPMVSFHLEMMPEEKSSILRYYADNNLIAEPQPVMLSYNGAHFSNKQKNLPNKDCFLNLQILGSSKSVAETILIKTAIAILSDNKTEDVYVDINSIGDKESTNKFVRELVNYYRKNINKMSSHCRQLFKKDAFSLLKSNKKECCAALNEEAPKSISFLSESSRQHFKEVLEGLEILNIPYRINNNLIPDRRYSSQTIFEITEGNENKKRVLASGGRYDGLAKKIGLKKDIPAIGLKISSKSLSAEKSVHLKIKPSSFFFLQLGFEAKLKGLNVIEMLRKSKILVYQSLSRDMLGGQIALAEKMQMPYILIMGKKESMDNTIMVRDMNTRSQEIIPIDNLSAYLKKLIKK